MSSNTTKTGTTATYRLGRKPTSATPAVAECTNGAFVTRLGIQTEKSTADENPVDWVAGISVLCSDKTNLTTLGWKPTRPSRLGELAPNGINTLIGSSGSVVDGLGYGSTLVGTIAGAGVWRQDQDASVKACFLTGLGGNYGSWIFNLDFKFVCPVATTSTSATASATSTSAPTLQPPPTDPPESNSAAIIAGSVGGVAAVAIFVFAGMTLLKRRRALAAAKPVAQDDVFDAPPAPAAARPTEDDLPHAGSGYWGTPAGTGAARPPPAPAATAALGTPTAARRLGRPPGFGDSATTITAICPAGSVATQLVVQTVQVSGVERIAGLRLACSDGSSAVAHWDSAAAPATLGDVVPGGISSLYSRANTAAGVEAIGYGAAPRTADVWRQDDDAAIKSCLLTGLAASVLDDRWIAGLDVKFACPSPPPSYVALAQNAGDGSPPPPPPPPPPPHGGLSVTTILFIVSGGFAVFVFTLAAWTCFRQRNVKYAHDELAIEVDVERGGVRNQLHVDDSDTSPALTAVPAPRRGSAPRAIAAYAAPKHGNSSRTGLAGAASGGAAGSSGSRHGGA
ncbi:hypothetical protein H9P43_008118 [Blastocladiella emersonii ATCC 22665]|nr:hypothetical protein H9P43_008118 [Blastocladiella emersonii ATCC 22665]